MGLRVPNLRKNPRDFESWKFPGLVYCKLFIGIQALVKLKLIKFLCHGIIP